MFTLLVFAKWYTYTMVFANMYQVQKLKSKDLSMFISGVIFGFVDVSGYMASPRLLNYVNGFRLMTIVSALSVLCLTIKILLVYFPTEVVAYNYVFTFLLMFVCSL